MDKIIREMKNFDLISISLAEGCAQLLEAIAQRIKP
jgi:hypothetical protein